jgi:hypothetical protein
MLQSDWSRIDRYILPLDVTQVGAWAVLDTVGTSKSLLKRGDDIVLEEVTKTRVIHARIVYDLD